MDRNILIFILILVILFIGHIFLNESFVDVSDTKYQAPSIYHGIVNDILIFYDENNNKLPGKLLPPGYMDDGWDPIYLFSSPELMTQEKIKREIEYLESYIKLREEIPKDDPTLSLLKNYLMDYFKSMSFEPDPYVSSPEKIKEMHNKFLVHGETDPTVLNNPTLLKEFNFISKYIKLKDEFNKMNESFVDIPKIIISPSPYYKSVYDPNKKGYITTFLDDLDGKPLPGEKLFTEDEYIQNPPRFDLLTDKSPTDSLNIDINVLKRRLEILKKRQAAQEAEEAQQAEAQQADLQVYRQLAQQALQSSPQQESQQQIKSARQVPTGYTLLDKQFISNLKSEIMNNIRQTYNFFTPDNTIDPFTNSIADIHGADFIRHRS